MIWDRLACCRVSDLTAKRCRVSDLTVKRCRTSECDLIVKRCRVGDLGFGRPKDSKSPKPKSLTLQRLTIKSFALQRLTVKFITYSATFNGSNRLLCNVWRPVYVTVGASDLLRVWGVHLTHVIYNVHMTADAVIWPRCLTTASKKVKRSWNHLFTCNCQIIYPVPFKIILNILFSKPFKTITLLVRKIENC